MHRETQHTQMTHAGGTADTCMHAEDTTDTEDTIRHSMQTRTCTEDTTDTERHNIYTEDTGDTADTCSGHAQRTQRTDI